MQGRQEEGVWLPQLAATTSHVTPLPPCAITEALMGELEKHLLGVFASSTSVTTSRCHT